MYALLNRGNLARTEGRFQPAIRDYMACLSVLRDEGSEVAQKFPLTAAQHEVARVLFDYWQLLKLKPQDHWHKVNSVRRSC